MKLILFRRLLIVTFLISIGSSLIEVRIAAQVRDGKSFAPPRSDRTRYSFNSDWKLFTGDQRGAADPAFDDSAWQVVTTPHAWNEDAAFRVSIADLPTGVAWYRKHFKLPADSRSQKVFLEFEGIRQGGEFYLNGELIGRHENGVMAFGFDITGRVKPAPQENVIAARIDNTWDYRERATNSVFQWNDRNFNANYGGINKNVYLHVTGRLYQTLPLYSSFGTTGVYVYGQDFDVAQRRATSRCANSGKERGRSRQKRQLSGVDRRS
jgi:hypothetical protein